MKDTFYFSHDYNSRNDIKIKKLIQKHGMCGYGLFWAIVEDLYQNDNRVPLDYDTLAFEYRVDESLIKSIINDFNLFVFDDNFFGSMSIEKRIDERDKKSSKARESAKARWGDCESRTQAKGCIFYVIEIFNQNENFIKVGITSSSVSRRYSGKLNGYSYNLIYQIDLDVEKSLLIESEIVSNFKNYTPLNVFAGSLECIESNEYELITDFVMRNYNFVMPEYSFRNAIKEIKVNDSKLNENKVNKVNNKIYDSELETLIFVFNQSFKTNYRSLETLKDNYAHWRKIYEPAEIETAIINASKDDFWQSALKPETLFRQKNPNKEKVDYIGQFLNLKPKVTERTKQVNAFEQAMYNINNK
ncbi:MAG: Lin1244/Lin1753 domain-containing protein [Saprospiraceae bacterium]